MGKNKDNQAKAKTKNSKSTANMEVAAELRPKKKNK